VITPVVRYMILCDDWRSDPNNSRQVTIVGLLSNINSIDQPPYPLLYRELCIFLVLTEGRGQGEGQIACVFEDTGMKVFETPRRPISFGSDLLDVTGVSFRVRDCPFPFRGMYSMQFLFDGVKIAEHPLLLR
jgi:hypothetical protein